MPQARLRALDLVVPPAVARGTVETAIRPPGVVSNWTPGKRKPAHVGRVAGSLGGPGKSEVIAGRPLGDSSLRPDRPAKHPGSHPARASARRPGSTVGKPRFPARGAAAAADRARTPRIGPERLEARPGGGWVARTHERASCGAPGRPAGPCSDRPTDRRVRSGKLPPGHLARLGRGFPLAPSLPPSVYLSPGSCSTKREGTPWGGQLAELSTPSRRGRETSLPWTAWSRNRNTVFQRNGNTVSHAKRVGDQAGGCGAPPGLVERP